MVRHGQARFLTDDYDRLSTLGEEQAAALANYWVRQGISPDEVYTGTLRRQQRTAEVVGEVFASHGLAWPAHQVLAGLDEYPADEIVGRLAPVLATTDQELAALMAAVEQSADDKNRYRNIHRLLEVIIARWVAADYDAGVAPGLMSWREFSDGVRAALQKIMASSGSGRTVAIFTSGGPVGVSMQTIMEAPEIKAAELNWRVHNCAVTHFTYSGPRISLDRFNDIAHLADGQLTYR